MGIRVKAGSRKVEFKPVMSDAEFARIGCGKLAYLHAQMTLEAVRKVSPKIAKDIAKQKLTHDLVVVFDADGDILAVMEARSQAMGYVLEHDLQIAHVH